MAVLSVLPGPQALSKSRTAEISNNIGARYVHGIYVHYVQAKRDLSAEESRILSRLLAYGVDSSPFTAAERTLEDALRSESPLRESNAVTVFVYPRKGTISPWSSQTTDIARERGLKECIIRIERGLAFSVEFKELVPKLENLPNWTENLHDRMIQEISLQVPELIRMFEEPSSEPTKVVLIDSIEDFNNEFSLGLDNELIEYLRAEFNRLQRAPTDVELFMFAQIHSEHCRHKQFNATWTIDGQRKERSLFDMIRNTHEQNPGHTISAYSDNAAVFEGVGSSHWAPNGLTGEYGHTKEEVHYLGKVETHNHPTAVSPHPGAATGSGGEIRDEGSVGRGSRPKAGLAGFAVSHLLIPEQKRPWELDVGKPDHVASSLEIMLEAPIGSADYNNEFGRPCLNGFFYSFLANLRLENGQNELHGYHKPIMIAGGVGTVRPQHALKEKGSVKAGDYLVIFGGPSMLIGLGGGAASSATSGQSSALLDFASVQRPNAEVQRRAQEVINSCTSLGLDNPILSIHDVGAGGLSNAVPELAHDSGLGVHLELRDIESADKSMSPYQVWSNESQERYVAAISAAKLSTFEKIANRERCGFSVPGRFTAEQSLHLSDRNFKDQPVPIDNLPMPVLFGRLPKLSKSDDRRQHKLSRFDSSLTTYLPKIPNEDVFRESVNRVFALPAVGSKSFLITIGDRTVGGLTVRDQMVGPWQVPVADVAVTTTSLVAGVKTGEAIATGARPSAALISPRASVRMAIGECLLNLGAADLPEPLSHAKLSANWMSATAHSGEGAALYDAVEAATDLCQQLGVSVPVGKDSLSMQMNWTHSKREQSKEVVTSPLSLIVTGFSRVKRIRRTWTPQLNRFEDIGENLLLFVDLANARNALGGSALAQTFSQIGDESPDVRDPTLLGDFFDALKQLHDCGIVLAYHDRSEGGLFTTLAEMMFAGRCGLDVMLDSVSRSSHARDIIECMFNEELGAVFQIRKRDEDAFRRCFATCGPPKGLIRRLGTVPPLQRAPRQELTLLYGTKVHYRETRGALQRLWASTSYHMQRLRDDPDCADAEYANIDQDSDPGLSYQLTFDPTESLIALKAKLPSYIPFIGSKPRVAILREQGVNGASEMAFAFHTAGFLAVDVHMTDIVSGRTSLDPFVGLAACGGFSYGDVLGAGRGWATGPTESHRLSKEFKAFFERPETFTLGVCNGCQFLSHLKNIIPGAEAWPKFETNTSERYEARVCMVGISDPAQKHEQENRMGLAPSVFLHGMHGSSIPIPVSHGEGRATLHPDASEAQQKTNLQGVVALRYVDTETLKPTERYPYNPNGSYKGIAGVRSIDGRVLAMMPHPERTIIRDCASWIPEKGWRRPASNNSSADDVGERFSATNETKSTRLGVGNNSKANAWGTGTAIADSAGWRNSTGNDADELWGDYGPWLRMFRSARRWVG